MGKREMATKYAIIMLVANAMQVNIDCYVGERKR